MKTYSILDKIRASVGIELARRKESVSFGSIFKAAMALPAAPNFADAIRKKRGAEPAVIAELKKASPSSGIMRPDFHPELLCSSLASAGAAALSVLTEENFFLGSLKYLKEVSSLVKVPLLRKDFIFDPYQICEAKINGASAVLLIARMLDDKEIKKLCDFAKKLSMSVLAEAHDELEIRRLLDAGADIIGVNCRDLGNFSTDFSVNERLLGLIPDGVVRVAESGIGDRSTFLRASESGADAVLIGSALMEAPDPGQKLSEILGAI